MNNVVQQQFLLVQQQAVALIQSVQPPSQLVFGVGGGGGSPTPAITGYALETTQANVLVELAAVLARLQQTLVVDTGLAQPLQQGGTVMVGNFPPTQAVSAASLPLPVGAATAAKQLPDNHLVVVSSSALPAGAATEATLANRNNPAATLLNLLPTPTDKVLYLKGHGVNGQFDYHFRTPYGTALDVPGEAIRFRRIGPLDPKAGTYSRTGATVTVTHTTEHNLESGDVVFHTGGTDTGLNQELVKVTVTSTLIYTYTTAATGTATGAITLQPAGTGVKYRDAVAMTALGSGW